MIHQNPDYKQTVIIGGGTAGWLTALCMSKLRNHGSQIWLVESKDVPNVGAGEGTTPHIIFLLRFLGINLENTFADKSDIADAILGGRGIDYLLNSLLSRA